jgi:hypothetical protein
MKQKTCFRPRLELLEERQNPSGAIAPIVNAGPPLTLQEGVGPIFTVQGSFNDSNTPAFDTGEFFVRQASNGALVDFGAIKINQPAQTLSYNLVNLPPGNYTVELDVTDDGVTGIGHTTLVMQSPPPTNPAAPVVNAGPTVTVTEGSQPNSIPMTASFVDPNAAGQTYLPCSFLVTDSNGNLVEDGGVQVNVQNGTLSYSVVEVLPGNYSVSLQLRDGNLTGLGFTSLDVLPNQAPPPPSAPVVVAPANETIAEGSTFGGVYSFSDQGPGPWKIDVNLGNGSPDLILNSSAPQAYSLAAVYFQQSSAQPGGAYHGTVTVTDLGDGQSGSAAFAVTVLPATPVVNAGPPTTVIQQTVIPLTASFSDPDSITNWTAQFTVRNVATGAFVEDGGVVVNQQSKTLQYNVVELSPGTYSIILQVSYGNVSGTAVTQLTVQSPVVQHAPQVVAPVNGAVNEGGIYTGIYSFSDPDGGPWTVVVNLGNGAAPLVFQKAQPGAYSFQAVYPRDSRLQAGGVYHGTVTVTDSTGLSSSGNFTVLVQDVPPTVEVSSELFGSWYNPALPVSAWYYDPDPAGIVTASYLVRNSFGQVVASGRGYVNPLNHTLEFLLPRLLPGRYTVSLSVTDDGMTTVAQTNLWELPYYYWWL